MRDCDHHAAAAAGDNFCRTCGAPLHRHAAAVSAAAAAAVAAVPPPQWTPPATRRRRRRWCASAHAGTLGVTSTVVLLVLLVLLGAAAWARQQHAKAGCAEGEENCSDANSDYGRNAGLWHTVGELFNREQSRQRKMKHQTADAVENGPKEISIFCPQDPTIRIVDLNEDERDRDECLVLNIAAPDVSSRLVLFCNAHEMGGAKDEDEDLGDGDIPTEEL